MSVSLSNVQQTLFDQMVKQAYQSKGFIFRDAAYVVSDVQGTVVSFRTVDSVTAEQYAFQSQVVYQDPGYNKVNVNLLPYRAPTLIDDVEQFLVNFSEQQYDADLIGKALGRRSDQVSINALNASTTTNTIANGGTGLTYAKVRQINKFFNSLAVPFEDRFIAISAQGEAQLMAELQFTDNRFTQLNAVTNGSLNGAYVMGMNWKVIPTMEEGGLPLSGNIRTCFAWHKRSLGVGIGKQFSTTIERVPQYDSWQCLGKIYLGAVNIDPVGVIKCDIDESVEETSALTVTTITA